MIEYKTIADRNVFPYLIVIEAEHTKEVTLQGTPVTIGRSTDNDLCLEDPKVSRQHARIDCKGAGYYITDLNTGNGTWVNGIRLTAPHLLKHGERITIGDAELTYKESVQPSEDAQKILPGALLQKAPVPKLVPRSQDRGWSLIVGLGIIAAILLLTLVAVAIYLLTSGVY